MAKETQPKAATASKKGTAGVAKATPAVSEEVVAEDKVEVKQPKKKVEAPAPKKEPAPANKLIKVKNMGTIRHYQASSGMRISVGETKEMFEDSWLRSMVRRKLFEIV